MTINHVISQGPTYGRSNAPLSVIENDASDWSTECCCVTLIHCLSHGLSAEGQSLRWGVADRSCDHRGHALGVHGTAECHTAMGMPLSKLNTNEGRSILVLGLLLQLLRFQGHSVSYITSLPEGVEFGCPDYSVWHLLKTVLPVEVKVQSGPTPTREEFVSAIASLPQCVGRSGKGVELDARGFIEHIGLSGKKGYDGNIQRIQVTDMAGNLSPAAESAYSVASAVCQSQVGAGHVTLYVAEQQTSFAMQRCMILNEAYNKAKQIEEQQHILISSEVSCLSRGGGKMVKCTLSDLLKARLEQMTEAYVVKYGERAKGTQLQNIATRMAEAVVKFELLSSNPPSNIKLELPPVSGDSSAPPGEATASGGADRDVRFSGSFVMYNYARAASILSHFKQECEKGTYSPLPKLSDVNFSLLKEEEEWQLIFQFVLQYPAVIREAAKMKKRGLGVHVEVALKKVCQFLTKLSHLFSTYYSRVKVLMPPEPHLLPLIHARLYLMTAVRQVMHNGLALLGIEPLEQL